VEVLEAGVGDPFRLPVRPVKSLAPLPSRGGYGRRVRAQGTVTLRRPTGSFFMRDATGPVFVMPTGAVQARPGDRVDVVGFLGVDDTPELADALVRPLGSGPRPLPIVTSATEARTGRYADELVQLDGTVVEVADESDLQLLTLQSGSTSFIATIPLSNQAERTSVKAGSLVRVTGVCVMVLDERGAPLTFRLRMERAQEVVLLKAPPGTYSTYVWWGLGALLAASGLGATWVAALRRQVRRQTALLRDAKEAAEQATSTKSQFLANVSHEMRTPMSGLLGMTELVLAGNLSRDQREHLELAHRSARSLLTLMDDLLDLARIEAGQVKLDHQPFSLAPMVKDAIDTVGTQAQEKGLVLACAIDPGVPARVAGDAGRIRQVLINLVGNAVKFTDRGGVTVRVVREDAAGQVVWLRFIVTDTGVGIPADQHAAIFAAFKQGDGSLTRRFGGAGLGLTISAQLVAMMGGTLTVESEPGRGSTFSFAVRFGLASSAESWSAASRSHVVSARAARRVLVAEDNYVNQRVVAAMLRQAGHQTVVVQNGREALDALAREPFDVVLMDVQMPEMSGLEATAALRERERALPGSRRTPVVALTAHAMGGDREECLAAGMDDYLSKPVTLEALVKAIERAGSLTGVSGRSDPEAGAA